MKPERTKIRHYVSNMLKGKVDVGDKIFTSRPSPVFISEVPCVLIYFQEETNKIIRGDKHNPHEYERDLKLCVDVLVAENIDPDADVNESLDTEDRLDFLGAQVEHRLGDDWTLSQDLPGYNPNDSESDYLSLGIAHEGTSSYNIDVSAERRISAQRATYSVPYITEAYANKKYSTFEEYKADFLEVKDGETQDHVLISAEGEIQ